MQTTLRTLASLCFTAVLMWSSQAIAANQFIDIAAKNVEEIRLVLDTLDASITNNLTDLPPIILMLHGEEARRFLRSNYSDNKSLVDQAAKLAAYNVVKVQICATWLEQNDYRGSDLFPFVSTVPFGVAELDRLADEEGYTEFSVGL